MKKLFLFCLGAGMLSVASAQRGYFLYLQTDDLSPFYVRMADKIYSSSTAGYIILPNLTDSTYVLGVGFAKSTQPETRFAVTVNQNDRGYLLKNFSEGLALFDLQELSLTKPVTAATNNTVYETKTDKFSSVLSKAADDPSLLQVPVAKKEEPKAVPEKKEPVGAKVDEPKAKAEEKEAVVTKVEEAKPTNDLPKDTAAAKPSDVSVRQGKKEEPTNVAVKPEESSNTSQPVVELKDEKKEQAAPVNINVQEPSVYIRSTVVRRSESSTTEGFGIVFLDKVGEAVDTIRILIPPAKGNPDAEVPTANLSQIEKRFETPVNTSAQPEEVKIAPATQPSVETKPKEDRPREKSVVSPASCKELASNRDFMKLRRNMAAEENDEAMIEEARKVFRNRCFTVEQIRYLSTLFLTSAAKYQFFDASYNHVSDKGNFGQLQGEIKDEYYLKRFKALVGE